MSADRVDNLEKELTDAFTNFGTDQSGYIKKEQLDVALRQLELPLDLPQVRQLISKQRDTIAFDAFAELVHEPNSPIVEPMRPESIRNMHRRRKIIFRSNRL